MKKNVILSAVMLLLCVSFTFAQTGGFANVSQPGTSTSVTSASAFISAIQTGNRTVYLNANISLSGMTDVASNTTIIGNGRTISGGGLDIDGVNNVIIKDIYFANWDDDGINMQDASTHAWVDHCSFTNGYDGACDVKRATDYVTVSWNRFYNHGKTCLLGHSDDNGSQDIGHLRVTYHHNYFDGTGSRHPRVRFSALCHVYNNYYRDNDYGVASCCDAEVLVEGCYFTSCNDNTLVGYAASWEGDLVQRNNVFNGGTVETRGSVPNPPYGYSMDNASNIPSIVSGNCGPGGGSSSSSSGGSSSGGSSSGGSSSGGNITVRARGTAGSEQIQLKVNNSTVATWTLGTSYQSYNASGYGDVSVHFINDGSGLDVQVDYVIYSGSTLQSENQGTNTGVWQDSSCGGSYSEWLHCNGYIAYGSSSSSSSGGSSSGGSSSGGSSSGGSVNGTYRITAEHSGKVIDVQNCGCGNGTNIQQWTWLNNDCQKWEISDQGSGWHRLSPRNCTSQAMDVTGWSTSDGANIQTWAWGGGAVQLFQMNIVSSGRWRIINQNSGKCIDVEGVSTADGANIFQWTCGSGSNQIFTLTSAKSEDIEANSTFNVYPNPANDLLNIQVENGTAFVIEVFDNTGRIMMTENMQGNSHTLEIGDLTSGIYLVKVSNGEQSYIQRVAKK